ncbi:DUF481 domain-containing protein [Silvibacterium acidisoli]|uniref:DUF481 domain-containing protein n=1 Tax=Acidobacteriaceae bacterium ZG23-2 TaxID=2883246 RepID=UPI00406C580D
MNLATRSPRSLPITFLLAAFALLLLGSGYAFAADGADGAKNAAKPAPDVIIFQNGDQLSGTFVREVGGTVTFHNDITGDINVSWDKIKELRTGSKLVVLDQSVTGKMKKKDKLPANTPEGTVTMANSMITVHPDNNAMIEPIPVKNAAYVLDENTVNKQLRGHPGFFQGWNGTMTAGATTVSSTQNQYTFSGAAALVRVVPTVTWLDPKNRTTADFSGSYGKITQNAYTSGGVFYPETNTKTSIYHADAERDQYFSPRLYYLGQAAFDHNFSLLLDLQQIYGGGIGWTAIKDPKQELDLKATVQYEKQSFIGDDTAANQNLIGSTFSANYTRTLPGKIAFAQQVSFIPAYNTPRAYSATETDGLTFPAYKNFGFTVGTLDTYLNDPAPAVPSTKRNSFQFTFGITYTAKSTY